MLLHLHLQLLGFLLRRLVRVEVEGLDPQQQPGGDLPVRGQHDPAVQVLAHLVLGHLVEADGALPAGFDELRLVERVDAFPQILAILAPQVCDVVAQLHLEVSRPPGGSLRQTEHPGHGGQLLGGHVLEADLLVEETCEPQDLLERRVLHTLHELLLEHLQLRGLVGKLLVGRLGDLLGALQDDLLPELCHLLLRLELARHCRIVVLLLEEGGRQHVREEPQCEGQEDLRKGDDDEE
mmetsp:Transcript_25533/g.64936  ORF Transcript_25533/g.64936 Transcript_25533/m.64936 type:complete len:237 (+) Transcript_25533:853-1563(+)